MRKRDKLDLLQAVKIKCPICGRSYGAVSYLAHIAKPDCYFGEKLQ